MRPFFEKIKNGLARESVFRRYLLNNLIVLILPLAALAIGSSWISGLLVTDSIEAQNRTLVQMVENLDEAIINIQTNAIQISNDSAVQRFYRVGRSLKAEDRIHAYSMMSALSKYYNYSELVEYFFIYFRQSGRIISSRAMYQPDFFFNKIVRYDGLSVEDWDEILTAGPYRSDYIRDVTTISESRTVPTITYMTSLPVETYRSNRAVLCVVLNAALVEKRLTGMAPGGALYVMNNNGDVLCAVGSTDAYDIEKASEYTKQEGIYCPTINSEKTTLLYKTSTSSGWKYLFIIPNAVLAKNAYAIKTILWQIVVLCLVIGMISAIRMTYVNYNPIDRLKKLAEKYSPSEGDSHGKNELNYIQESIEETHRKNEQLNMQQREMMEKYERLTRFNIGNRQVLLDGLIVRMTRGQIEDWDAVRAWLSTAEISCDKPCFCIAMVHIDLQGSFSLQEGKPKEELAIFTTKSVMLESCVTLGYCYAVSTAKDTLMLMINMDEDSEGSLRNILQKAQSYLAEAFEIQISIGLGKVVHSIKNVQNSYVQAVHTLAYRFVKGKGSLISYEETVACDRDPIKLSTQFTEELSDAIRRKSVCRVRKILDRTYEEWFKNRQLSMFQAQSLYFFVINITMSALDDINIDLTAMTREGINPLDALIACDTIDDVFAVLNDILTTACEYSTTIGKRDQLAQAALSYIGQNFHRMDFSQTMVAQVLNVTPTYLSRVIKAVTGRNMVDILNDMRIDKAKELLLYTDNSLSSIAEAVGISSVKSLIRVFKQHTGMTPGRLRESPLSETKRSAPRENS